MPHEGVQQRSRGQHRVMVSEARGESLEPGTERDWPVFASLEEGSSKIAMLFSRIEMYDQD